MMCCIWWFTMESSSMSDVRTARAIPLPGLEFLRFLLVREVLHDWTLKNLFVFTLPLVLSPQKPLVLFLPIPSLTLARWRPFRVAQAESIAKSITEIDTFLDLVTFCSMEFVWGKSKTTLIKYQTFQTICTISWGIITGEIQVKRAPKRRDFSENPLFKLENW